MHPKVLRFAGGYSPPATLAHGRQIDQSVKQTNRKLLMAWRNGLLVANAKSLVAQENPRLVCDVVKLATYKCRELRRTGQSISGSIRIMHTRHS